MRKIVDILMTRDNLSRDEAERLISDTIDEIDEAVFYGAGIEEVEDILASNLGLESDYLDELFLNM